MGTYWDDTLNIVGAIILGVYCIVITFIFIKNFIVVKYMTAVVIERCGIYKEVLEPGPHCLCPFYDKPVAISSTLYHIHYNRGHAAEDVHVTRNIEINLRE